MLLNGKTAVITGCSRGIGKATVEVFAREGADVFATVRTLNDEFNNFCKDTENKYSVNVFPIVMDITKENEVKAAVETITKKKKPIDILVNNAGIAITNTLFVMTNFAQQKEVFETNFFGNILVTQNIVPIMQNNVGGGQ